MLRLFLSSCFFAVMLTGLARAGDHRSLFFNRDGVALSGYDTVAYFVDGAAVRGRQDIAVMWRGVVWQFANLFHRELFEANPRAYAPQYGGYCAHGMAFGRASSTDPQAWAIREGKLYLIHSKAQRDLWLLAPSDFVARANAHWPKALHR
ncbi:YHS domain-containing (seleno)protein [Pseudodonghicola sp. IC7]|uniref:YHS domain-containing (Seleno)protein n=2 Tax=Pseudodonghicola flavimaris TaxID=3050036 RepID=A0ABT7F085_9RHOB|nr:YHS domain-containing (seleno)protein [Pseudodonghicola flavimaris]